MSSDRRGRDATSPTEIPRLGWRDIALRMKKEVDDDNLLIVAAGLAFYAFLSLFPTLAALVSTYGLVFDRSDVYNQVAELRGVLPPAAISLVQQQLLEIAKGQDSALGVGVIIGLLFALFSARQGAAALMKALNIAYNQDDGRGIIKRTLIALAAVLITVIGASVALMVIVVFPTAAELVELEGRDYWVWNGLRWLVLLIVLFVGLGATYRYAPNRRRARLPWVTPGAILATLMWTLGSLGFSIYVSSSSSYNRTYGSIAAVVIVQMWLYLGALSVLLGGKLNAVIEHQTNRDTTVGPERAMGERGAYVADTVGKSM